MNLYIHTYRFIVVTFSKFHLVCTCFALEKMQNAFIQYLILIEHSFCCYRSFFCRSWLSLDELCIQNQIFIAQNNPFFEITTTKTIVTSIKLFKFMCGKNSTCGAAGLRVSYVIRPSLNIANVGYECVCVCACVSQSHMMQPPICTLFFCFRLSIFTNGFVVFCGCFCCYMPLRLAITLSLTLNPNPTLFFNSSLFLCFSVDWKAIFESVVFPCDWIIHTQWVEKHNDYQRRNVKHQKFFFLCVRCQKKVFLIQSTKPELFDDYAMEKKHTAIEY